jgi:type I restriction enzyme S subunit
MKENIKQLGAVVQPRRKKVTPQEFPNLPYVGLEHVEAHTSRLVGSSSAAEMKSAANQFFPGDVLYSRLRPYLNKVWRADREGLCSSEFIVLPGNDGIDADFLRYRLNSSDFVSFANSLNAGDRPRVDFDQISKFETWIPPSLDEQRQVVAEIEKQFTRLDAGVAALRRVQANLKRYRAAVLKAACEGRLVATEAELAGKEGRTFETGEQLLKRILADRRKNWTGRSKYEDPIGPKIADCAPLPDSWTWASIEQITANFDGRRVPLKSADRDKRSGQYPYYGASGIIDDIDDFLFDGDFLLIAEDGANLLSRSTPIAFKASGRFWVNNHAHIVQTLGGSPLSYLAIVLNGTDLTFSVTGSAQPKLTQAALNKIPVPLPPLAEQMRIVAEVERRLSVIDELETLVTTNLARATRLRQSVLQSAFSKQCQGRL